MSQRWASWFSNQDLQMAPKPPPTTVHQTTLSQTFYTAPIAPASVGDLVPDSDRRSTRGILASTTWLKGAFSTETEVAANQGATVGLSPHMTAQSDDPSTRMMRLGIASSLGPVRYGMKYRQAGDAFYNESDQALKEIWSEWKEGGTTWRSTIGQQWNQLQAHAGRPRVEQQYSRHGLSWAKPDWPNFDLTYSKNAQNGRQDPIGVEPPKKDSHTLEAALGYSGSMWKATMATSYSLESDLMRNGDDRVKTQTVTASLRPLDGLTIAPTLGYRAEQQEWSGVRVNSPSVSLAMNYQQSQRLLISALGNFSEVRSSDRVIDIENVGGKGVLAWDLQQSRDWKTMLSVEGAYNRQINVVTPSAQTEDLSGILRLVLAPL